MKLENLEVAVVGGATAGCAAALFLARARARVTLLERVAEPRAVGAGIGIAANGMAVLDALRLGEAVRARACSVAGARVVDARGRVLLDPGETSSRVWMMRRSDLQSLLLEAVAREPGIAARFGAEALSAHPDGRVLLSAPGDGSEIAADLVVGGDGVHSKVRAGGDFGARVDPEGVAYLRGIAEGVEPLNEEAWTPAGLFGSFPIPGGTYWYASAGAPAVSRALGDGDLAAFRAAWLRAYPRAERIFAALASLDALDVRRVVRVECRTWHSGRLVLAGDAAHAMAPNLGQGANSALVDAAVLRDELEKAPDLESGLAAYQGRRQRAVRRVAVTAARLGALAERTGGVARFLRDRILMPVAARLTGPGAEATLFQEPPEILRAIGSS